MSQCTGSTGHQINKPGVSVNKVPVKGIQFEEPLIPQSKSVKKSYLCNSAKPDIQCVFFHLTPLIVKALSL